MIRSETFVSGEFCCGDGHTGSTTNWGSEYKIMSSEKSSMLETMSLQSLYRYIDHHSGSLPVSAIDNRETHRCVTCSVYSHVNATLEALCIRSS